MKKLAYSLVALSLLACAVSNADEAKPVAATPKRDFSNVKFASIDMYAIFDKSKEGADLQEAIKTDVEGRIKNIQSLEAEIQKTESELSAGSANVLNSEAREKRQKKLLSLKNEIMIEQRAAQEIPQQRAEMAQMDILKKIQTTAQKVAKDLGIDVVLAGSTIYVDDRLDITELVVNELNKNYKPAKAATPKPAAK